MSKKRTKKEIQSVQAFEKALGEEVSVSAEFELPLAVLVAGAKGEWEEDALRRALGTLRTADLVTKPDPSELLVALPNTGTAEARVVEERIREAVPEAALGVASYTRGDSAADLLKRARAARRATKDPDI